MNFRVEMAFKSPESPFIDETGGSRGSYSVAHMSLNQRTVLLEIVETVEVGVILGFPGNGNIGIGLDDVSGFKGTLLSATFFITKLARILWCAITQEMWSTFPNSNLFICVDSLCWSG